MRIGSIELPTPFAQAGLAGYSDRAMRLVARRRGCPYAVTEALLDIVMLNGGEGLRRSIDINDEDHPIAGQIIGSDPHQMARAAQILHKAGYDVIDLNFACPVKKIKNKARGGHMLKDADRAVTILKAVRDALPPDVPTTVSLRRAFDESAESSDAFYRILTAMWDNGYSAVRVHARTVEQKYVGVSRWEFLRQLKRLYPDRVIFGSGDVFTAEDAVRMLRETGVDGAWIARGAIGNPWIFQHATELLRLPTSADPTTSLLCPPSIYQQRGAMSEHFQIAMQIHGEQLAARRMRKMGIKYSRFHPQSAEVKREFIEIRSLRQWQAVLDRWYAADGPGVWPDPKAADEVNAADPQGCGAA
jgi:nifR3 family TIM-barrel protein